MGDPKVVTDTDMPSIDELTNNTFIAFGDLDASPTKAYLIKHRLDQRRFYELSFAQRPREELYDLKNDPDQMNNVAYWSRYQDQRQQMHDELVAELKGLGDPRVQGEGEHFERPPYAGKL